MLKRIISISLVLSLGMILIAGDTASYVDEGFSADGEYYVFGQYGNTSGTNQGYAEIYTIDIDENDYEDDGLFFTNASVKTRGKNGHNLYTIMRNVNSKFLDGLHLKTVGIDSVLYLKGEAQTNNEDLVITDFEGREQYSYKFMLKPWYSGNTASDSSSFFIIVEKYEENVLKGKQVIGNPDTKRKGVVGYSIQKILKSPNEENFIVVVEKKYADESVRYMVETLCIENF